MLELNLIDEAVQTVPRNETMVGLLREIGDRLVRIEKNNTNNTGEAKTPILVPGAEQVENSHEYELVSNAKNEVEVTAGLADAENVRISTTKRMKVEIMKISYPASHPSSRF